MSSDDESAQFEELLAYLKESRGFDFSGYKRTTLQRRVKKRMDMVKCRTFPSYQRILEKKPGEFGELFNTILINVTAFFRDAAAWEVIRNQILPEIIEKAGDKPIRVWSAGCASGEEPYTLAILLADALGNERFARQVKIYGTDADDDALMHARAGTFSAKQINDVPPELLEKYFDRINSSYTFRKEIRRHIIFGRHDLFQDPPISKIDLLVCRNTLMYFNRDAQSRILRKMHFALDPEGFLFLGKSEMLMSQGELFTPVMAGQRIFQKTAGSSAVERRDIGDAHERVAQPAKKDGRSPESLAVDLGPNAMFVLSPAGQVQLINQQARMLFGLKQSDLGKAFSDLEISYRPADLRSQIDTAVADQRPVTLREVAWTTPPEGDARYFDIEVIPIMNAAADVEGLTIVFSEVTRYRRLHEQLEKSQQRLEVAYGELQSTVEELETTNEELHSTNEELETTNEELQSTNEELETMNEELHSTNEELETMNEEIQQRTIALDEAHATLEAILTSLQMGLVAVDRSMRIEIWNSKAEDLWGLNAREVTGEHLLNLDIGLPVDELRQPLRACITGKAAEQTLKLEATNRRGRAFTCIVTINPLETGDGTVRGAIVLMEPEGLQRGSA